jgi:hypothetical protein
MTPHALAAAVSTEARPLNAVIRFFRGDRDNQERLSGTGCDLLEDMVKKPAAPPGGSVRTDDDEITIVFYGSMQDHVGHIAPAYMCVIGHPGLLSRSRDACQASLTLRHDTSPG